MRDKEETNEDSSEEFLSHGCFDPLEARRLLGRFEREGVRFRVAGQSGLVYGRWCTQLRRFDEIEIRVHRDDEAKAEQIISGGATS